MDNNHNFNKMHLKCVRQSTQLLSTRLEPGLVRSGNIIFTVAPVKRTMIDSRIGRLRIMAR